MVHVHRVIHGELDKRGAAGFSNRRLRLMPSELRRGSHSIGEVLSKVNPLGQCMVDLCPACVLQFLVDQWRRSPLHHATRARVRLLAFAHVLKSSRKSHDIELESMENRQHHRVVAICIQPKVLRSFCECRRRRSPLKRPLQIVPQSVCFDRILTLGGLVLLSSAIEKIPTKTTNHETILHVL
jgi:hypothetical protein